MRIIVLTDYEHPGLEPPTRVCSLCGRLHERVRVRASLGDPGAGDVCLDCAGADPDELRERMRSHAEQLRDEADRLERLALEDVAVERQYRERPKRHGRSTIGGKSRVTGVVSEPFEELTRRAVEMAAGEDLEEPYRRLLGLLEGAQAPDPEGPDDLLEEARLGADYKRLAAAGRAVGLDGAGRSHLYKLAAQVPLTDYHARILLDRLEGGGADTPQP